MRVWYLLRALGRQLDSCLQYRGGMMPMVSCLLRKGRKFDRPKFATLAPGDYELAVTAEDVGKTMACPVDRLLELRARYSRRQAALKAVETRRLREAKQPPQLRLVENEPAPPKQIEAPQPKPSGLSEAHLREREKYFEQLIPRLLAQEFDDPRVARACRNLADEHFTELLSRLSARGWTADQLRSVQDLRNGISKLPVVVPSANDKAGWQHGSHIDSLPTQRPPNDMQRAEQLEAEARAATERARRIIERPSLAMLFKAKSLVEHGDHEAFTAWLNRRTPSERIAILDYVREYPGKERTMTLVNPRHLPSTDAIKQIADRAESK
jgi:hypothetical protein